MAKKSGLRDAAVRVGAAVGKIDSKAHKAHKAALKAAHVAREEFADLTKQLEALKRQLEKSTKRLKSALK